MVGGDLGYMLGPMVVTEPFGLHNPGDALAVLAGFFISLLLVSFKGFARLCYFRKNREQDRLETPGGHATPGRDCHHAVILANCNRNVPAGLFA